jgi:hypothetical protein
VPLVLFSRAMSPSEKRELSVHVGDVPLHWRMPNPPAVFIGRQDERVRLRRLLRRAPLTVISGAGGTGKSALIAQVLSEDLNEATVIRVGMRPSDNLAQLCVTLLKGAFEVTGRSAQDWSNAAQSMRLLMSAVLEVAEAARLVFVLEDLHHGDVAEIDAFLILLHQYASNSRWVVTMRRCAELPIMEEQHLALQGLSVDELTELARRCSPERSIDELTLLAEQAHGSPWRLRQILSQTPLGSESSRSVLDQLDTASAGLIRALSVLELPLPPDVLEQFTELPPPARLGELVQEGILDPRPDRLRLHDRARQAIRDELEETQSKVLQLRLVKGLKEDHRSASRLEAIRLAISVDIADARRLLDEHASELIGRGHAPRIWEMLASTPDSQLDGWRFKLAIHLAGGEPILWAISRPQPTTPTERASWISIQYIAGRAQVALEAAMALRSEVSLETHPQISLMCALTTYRSLMQLGRTAEACHLLNSIESTNPLVCMQRDAALARALVVSGRYEAGMRLADKVRSDGSRSAGSLGHEVRGEIASAFILLGRLRDAAETLGDPEGVLEDQRPVHSVGERLRQLFLDVRRGDIKQANRWIESLHDGPKTVSVLSIFVRVQQAVLAIAMGDLERAADMIDGSVKEAHRSRNGYMYQWGEFTRLTLAWHRGERFESRPLPDELSMPVGPQAVAIAAFERAQAIRFGEPHQADATETPVLEAYIIDLIASAEAALISADPLQARAHATHAFRLCDEHGLGLVQVDVLRVLCDIELVSGDLKRLATRAVELSDRLQGSRYYGPLAAFYLGMSQRDGPSGRALWTWSNMVDSSPVLAGRCRSLLDFDAGPRHEVDAVILKVVRERLGETLILYPEARQCWGLDVRQKRVWIDDREIDLGRSALPLRILEFIGSNGGRATKAELATHVWEITEYHPLNDDKRIHVTIRRLRQQLVDEPDPQLLVTTDDGYAFGSSRAFILLGTLDTSPR